MHYGFVSMCFKYQAVAGLAADGRQIVARAKSEATNYERFVFLPMAFSAILFYNPLYPYMFLYIVPRFDNIVVVIL